jgi:hypothetical protein
LGTTAISFSSAWAYGEVKGGPHSWEIPAGKAPGFYLTYVVCVALANSNRADSWRPLAVDDFGGAGMSRSHAAFGDYFSAAL